MESIVRSDAPTPTVVIHIPGTNRLLAGGVWVHRHAQPDCAERFVGIEHRLCLRQRVGIWFNQRLIEQRVVVAQQVERIILVLFLRFIVR